MCVTIREVQQKILKVLLFLQLRNKETSLLFTGSNDISSNDTDTIDNLQSIINEVTKQSSHTKLAISSILTRKDVNGYDKKSSRIKF